VPLSQGQLRVRLRACSNRSPVAPRHRKARSQGTRTTVARRTSAIGPVPADWDLRLVRDPVDRVGAWVMKQLEEEAKASPGWGDEPDDHQRPPAPSASQRSNQDESLEDPVAYHVFVQSLLAKIEPRLRVKLDSDVQVEIANLTRLLTTMPRKVLAANRIYFELVFDLLSEEQPNLLLIRSVRVQLAVMNESSTPGIVRMIAHISGATPLNAAISALLSISVVSILWLWFMVGGYVPLAQGMAADVLLFSANDKHSVALIMLAMHAYLLGSSISILSRIQDYLLTPTLSPVLIYVSVISKPLLSVAVAILAFAVLKAGIISFIGVDLNSPSAPYLAWVLGFLCGFSERFAQDFVISTIGTFGEPHPLDLKSAQQRSTNRDRTGSPSDH